MIKNRKIKQFRLTEAMRFSFIYLFYVFVRHLGGKISFWACWWTKSSKKLPKMTDVCHLFFWRGEKEGQSLRWVGGGGNFSSRKLCLFLMPPLSLIPTICRFPSTAIEGQNAFLRGQSQNLPTDLCNHFLLMGENMEAELPRGVQFALLRPPFVNCSPFTSSTLEAYTFSLYPVL